MPLVRKGASPPPPPPSDTAAAGLRSSDPDARWSAARSLAGAPDAGPALAEALGRETDERVREAILTSLARTGDRASAAVILPLVRSDDAKLRTAALDALRLMPQALAEHLETLLTDPDTDVRILACDLARQLPGPVATRLLSRILTDDPDVNVCAAAVDVLAEAGDHDALPALAACEARFQSTPFLPFAIRVVRGRIESAPEPRG